MDFEQALKAWLEGAQKKIDEHYAANYTNLSPPRLEIQRGSKRIRVVCGGSAWAFIDPNGDVLKAASWAKPAKHARGNIFDEHGGLKHVSSYGPACLRG